MNLSWITDELGVGGRFLADEVTRLREQRIRAVIDLRAGRCDDEALLRDHGIELLHLPTPDIEPLDEHRMRVGLAFAARFRGERILVHCEHGIGRSALLALCILVDRGVDPIGAMVIAKARRPIVRPSPSQYETWAAWLERTGRSAPSFDAFATVMYR